MQQMQRQVTEYQNMIPVFLREKNVRMANQLVQKVECILFQHERELRRFLGLTGCQTGPNLPPVN